MMSDLAHLFAQLERDEYSAIGDAQLPPNGRQGVRGTVVRARRVRAALHVAVAVVAVVACGTGAIAWAQWDRSAPAAREPSPSMTTSMSSLAPTPSVTSEPELTMPAFTGDVAVDRQVPSAQAITPEAWNGAGPGWVLATYRETEYHYDDVTLSASYTYGPQVAYLISPDGERFQLSAIQGEANVRVVAWTPLSTSALAIEETGPDNTELQGAWVVLDLVSGATRPLTDADVTGSDWDASRLNDLLGVTAGAVSSDFRTIANAAPLELLAPAPAPSATGYDEAAAIDTAQGLVPDGEECVETLTVATTVVVACGQDFIYDGEPGGWFVHNFVFVDDRGRGTGKVVDVRIPDTYGNDSLELSSYISNWSAGFIGDTVIAMAIDEGYDPCPAGRYTVTPAGPVPLPGVEALRQTSVAINAFFSAGIVDESVYTVVTGGCSGDDMPEALVRDDIASGTSVVLVPLAPQPSSGSGWVVSSLESAYVVGATK